MSKRWFFGMSGRDVHLQARAEGPGGSDAYHTVRPGEKFLGFSYDASLRVAFCILRPRPMFLLGKHRPGMCGNSAHRRTPSRARLRMCQRAVSGEAGGASCDGYPNG